MDYGISTHLYHDRRLGPAHLAEIAAHGFRRVEVFATRTHFDYHDARAIAALGEALLANGLSLHALHAPIVDRLSDGQWGQVISLAASDAARRDHAIGETELAIAVSRELPYEHLVVHLGVPADLQDAAGPNSRESASASLQRLAETADRAGVRLAVEVIPNDLSEAVRLAELIEDKLDLPNVGVCLDFGHAHLMGGVADTVDGASGLITTTHVHDNRGQVDDHLVPFEGSIDWAAALTIMQKVGYDGTLVFEIARYDTPASLLARTAEARQRFERILAGGFA